MVQYEPKVQQADKDRIGDKLSQYMMNIRHDVDQYRHLHCYLPDNPIEPGNCSFDVITAPHSVTIYGDWMRASTLRCYGGEPDMLLDFFNTKELNIAYWAEKLDMEPHAKNAAITAIDTEAFFEDVKKSITQWLIGNKLPHSDSIIDHSVNDIRDDISFDDPMHPFEQLLDSAIYVGPHSYYEDASNIFDPKGVPGEHYTLEWVKTCMALQWAAQTYAAARSYKRQKQIRRYLTMERHMTLCEHTPLEKPPVLGI